MLVVYPYIIHQWNVGHASLIIHQWYVGRVSLYNSPVELLVMSPYKIHQWNVGLIAPVECWSYCTSGMLVMSAYIIHQWNAGNVSRYICINKDSVMLSSFNFCLIKT